MKHNVHSARSGLRAFCLGTAALAASPALADHMGPSGFGSGGGLGILSPDTLDEGHAGLGLRFVYTRPERRSDPQLEALSELGVDAHNTDYNLNAAVGAAYGITHDLTVSAELPYLRRDNLRAAEHGAVEHLGGVSGVGDLSLLAKYRLAHGEHGGVALIGGIKVPTGSTHKTSPGGERLETEHQPGTGSWDPIFGLAAGTRAGPFAVSASLLYQLSTKGAQRTRLGDRLQSGIALSHRFGEPESAHRESINHHHGDELDEHSGVHHASWDAFAELIGEWEGRQKIGGEVEEESGGKTLWLAPGARFNSASGLSLAASFGVPLWQRIRKSHPDNDYRLTLSLGKAF
jgi:Putative MetA-pathway of phenol degradation